MADIACRSCCDAVSSNDIGAIVSVFVTEIGSRTSGTGQREGVQIVVKEVAGIGVLGNISKHLTARHSVGVLSDVINVAVQSNSMLVLSFVVLNTKSVLSYFQKWISHLKHHLSSSVHRDMRKGKSREINVAQRHVVAVNFFAIQVSDNTIVDGEGEHDSFIWLEGRSSETGSVV